MFCTLKKKNIYPTSTSNNNSNRKRQVMLLMIPNEEKREANTEGRWHYLTVKKLLTLLRGVTSKHHGDFYCLNCFRSFATEKRNLICIKKVCENKDFCNVIMPSEDTKIFKFNQYQKSDKGPFIIYADLECITKTIDGWENDSENSYATKVSEHIPSSFSMSAVSSCRSIEKKLDVCRCKDCMKKSCEFVMKIISFFKKDEVSNNGAQICYICKEKFENECLKD